MTATGYCGECGLVVDLAPDGRLGPHRTPPCPGTGGKPLLAPSGEVERFAFSPERILARCRECRRLVEVDTTAHHRSGWTFASHEMPRPKMTRYGPRWTCEGSWALVYKSLG